MNERKIKDLPRPVLVYTKFCAYFLPIFFARVYSQIHLEQPAVVHSGYIRCECLLLEDHACFLTPTDGATGMGNTSWRLFVALDSSLLCCVCCQEFFITCLNWTATNTTGQWSAKGWMQMPTSPSWSRKKTRGTTARRKMCSVYFWRSMHGS